MTPSGFTPRQHAAAVAAVLALGLLFHGAFDMIRGGSVPDAAAHAVSATVILPPALR